MTQMSPMSCSTGSHRLGDQDLLEDEEGSWVWDWRVKGSEGVRGLWGRGLL